MTSEIAIIEKNTLTALGLQTILEELIPQAVIRVFRFDSNILRAYGFLSGKKT